MATLGGSRGDRPGNSNHLKSSLVSPEKVRELLNDGVSSANIGTKRCILFGLKGHKKNTLTSASFVSHLASQLCYFTLATVRRVSTHLGAFRPVIYTVALSCAYYLVRLPARFMFVVFMLSSSRAQLQIWWREG